MTIAKSTQSTLEVVRAGIQSTVQDQGRGGYRHLGVAQSGALDAPALLLANRLVNNPAHFAGLELVVGPIALRFSSASWFVICGADFEAELDGDPVRSGWRSYAAAGQLLTLRGAKQGMRAYLAVAGGIAVPQILGSRSTDIAAQFGGFFGRALQNGDRLPIGVVAAGAECDRPAGCLQRLWTPELRVLPGPEYQEFGDAAQQAFWQQAWGVSHQSNRMGYRLEGTPLLRATPGDLLSHAVLPGVIQVPPNGLPIVLLADAQATGGYPRIGVVIQADLWKLAQARPGTRFCFIQSDLAQARAAQKKWQQEQYRLEWSLYGT
ncbi:biotin-dependent carboxyltransferase family protein [Undibacterium sp. Ren11W]|uniref:5-oxoprolinase subunit C family protein n=1 Tax=Undibacterium sp. Ren11W TaxID=3413045 RepID=UPI003BEF6E17